MIQKNITELIEQAKNIYHFQKTNGNRNYCTRCSNFFDINEYKYHAEMECKKPDTCFIKSVITVQGNKLNASWNEDMQIVDTDIGTFIDNLPGKQFGFFERAYPGFNWKILESKEISDFRIIYDKGFLWINKKS